MRGAMISLRLRENETARANTCKYLRERKHALSKVYIHTYMRDTPFSSTQRGRVVSIKRTIIFSSIIHYVCCRNNCHPHESFSLSLSFCLSFSYFFFIRFALVLGKTDFPFFSRLKHESAYGVILKQINFLFVEKYFNITKNATLFLLHNSVT